ncbi:hypothetical protein BOW53_02840 [Solemya pervernicosa gill symbiont]|uniref:HTH cro/C1-type domain-containing protein n=1 Tax=Solemya pervernicosa gill symbiont TaxID=642797 RepID=A0A1T2L959_9GAMM|nr:helix-turn-helix domain-containing protein [Solemya pervernicosa gill symbiont]OOZ41633.1 hypothetical protein BOW53_02840 [Solemya pervernicosa gill symbiont]
MTNNSNSDWDATLEKLKGDAFAARVVELIEEFKNVANLARACGLSESVIRKWRDEKSEPSRPNLVKLAYNTGVSLEWLILGDHPKYVNEIDRNAAIRGAGALDRVALHTVLRLLDEALEDRGLRLDADKKAQAIDLLYDLYMETENKDEFDGKKVAKIISLAA